jgi:hypothetical protein
VSAERVHTTIVAAADGFGSELAAAVGVEAAQLAPARIAEAGKAPVVSPEADRLVWIHALPARPTAVAALGESELLLASADAAEAAARAAGARLTFIALLPAQGLFTGPLGDACDHGRSTMRGLVESRVAAWSQAGWRVLGLVHGGLAERRVEGERDPEAVRQRTPMDRPAALAELAGAIRYLGSDRAEYVTGTFLHVDGGWRAYSWIYPARTI